MLLFMLLQGYPNIYTLVHWYTRILIIMCDMPYDFQKTKNMDKHKL